MSMRSQLAKRLAAALMPLAAMSPAQSEETSTKEIFTATISAVPQCFRWRPKGICLWLKCTWFSCNVESTFRVQHFTPDVTVSTWHDPATHPWKDYGRVIAQRLDGVGEKLIGGIGGAGSVFRLDSAGTKTKNDRDTRNFIFRGTDAIGNPANVVQGVLTGNFGTGSGPDSVAVPTPAELARWFTEFPAQVAQQWASIPGGLMGSHMGVAQQQTSGWSGLLGLAGGAGAMAGQLSGLYDSVIGAYTTAGNVLQLVDGGGNGGGGGGGNAGSGTSGSDFMCPPGIMPFGLAYQSDLDALFWRSFVPLENIYPATWLPGMREVGQGLLQTWGNVWPRQGATFQQDPVKGAAVLAQRAGDIISYRAQPHIYAPLQLDSDPSYRFFGFQGIREHDSDQTRWQRVFPNPQRTCAAFGTNDSLSPADFGDGQNLNSRGTVWNAWRRQDCCRKPSGGAVFFLGTIGG
jgi:integrating conjugative element protein (TIGR03756 family)